MRSSQRSVGIFAWLLVIVPLVPTVAFGQAQTGNVLGKVVDKQKAALPGVTVTLSGIGAPQVFLADAQGLFRFIGLSPGTYTLTADLPGFATVVRSNVSVNVGRNTSVELELTPALEQTITVTTETPLLDVRKTGTGATVTNVELEEVPTARDPWVILQQVPGVLLNDINVGGNQSGQQSVLVSKGAGVAQTTYNVDGVNITDMAATGTSPTYYDFGSFQEIQVTTGGTDPRVMTPGAQINMVTKRGTNALSGAARIYYSDHGMQATASIPDEAKSYLGSVNEIDLNQEYGLDIGGPIVKDHLWLWGAYADQKIDLFVGTPAGQAVRYPDNTTLETFNFKLNAQINPSNSVVATWSNNEKNKTGRSAGPTRPPETTWNQGEFGPKGFWKVEDTHIFNPSFYLTGLYSKIPGAGFYVLPDGGKDCKDVACAESLLPAWTPDFSNWNRSFLGGTILHPQKEYGIDGSCFFDTGAANHELKFGFGYRDARSDTFMFWPGNQVVYNYGYPGPESTVRLLRSGNAPFEMTYNNAYVGDTILWGNLTVQVGARYDDQKQAALDSHADANPDFPDLLPAISVPGSFYGEMRWDNVSPRIGLTYAIGQYEKTLVRAAYNRYVNQMGGSSGAGNNATTPYAYLYYYFTDLNGDHIAQRNEIQFTGNYGFGDNGVIYAYGVDPSNPSAPVVQVRYGKQTKAPTTDELILGVEHEFHQGLAIGVTYTHRKMNDFLWDQYEKTQGAGDYYTTADYVLYATYNDTLPDGSTHSVPVYALKDGEPSPFYRVVNNRPGYSQSYDGVELTAVKRLSNRWMFRGNISWTDWTQSVSAEGIVDPTKLRSGFGCSTCDGSIVAQGSGGIAGPFAGVYINSKWACTLTGLYTIPVIETNVGFDFTGRQGYPEPYFHRTPILPGTGSRDIVLIDGVDSGRLPNPFTLDLRLSKVLRFRGVGVEVSVDAFNVTNERTVLQRELRIYNGTIPYSQGNRIRELVSPRIYRVGARVNF